MAEEKKESTAPTTPASDTPVITQGKPGDSKTTETVSVPISSSKTTPLPQQGNGLQESLFYILPMIIIFYLLMIRPEKKRREQQLALLSAIKKNDKVVLAAIGIYGTVADIDGEDVTLIIDPKKDVRIKVRKDAIGGVVNPEEKEKK